MQIIYFTYYGYKIINIDNVKRSLFLLKSYWNLEQHNKELVGGFPMAMEIKTTIRHLIIFGYHIFTL